MVMWTETLRSSDLYGGLMEEVDEVGILVGPCDRMMSSMGAVVGSAWYDVSQSSVCVGA